MKSQGTWYTHEKRKLLCKERYFSTSHHYFFELKEGLIISLKAIRANKVRSALTTIGIVIGIWAVVTMSTAIKGIDIAFQTGVASLGSDNLYIDKFENKIIFYHS